MPEFILSDLSNKTTTELKQSCEIVALQEKAKTAELIAHLAEIGDRKAHLDWGYKNLFEYCVHGLALGRGTVWSRLQVAGVCRRFPKALDALAKGTHSLTVLGVLKKKSTKSTERQVNATLTERNEPIRGNSASNQSPPGKRDDCGTERIEPALKRSARGRVDARSAGGLDSSQNGTRNRRRHVPAAEKHKALSRAGYQCEYRGDGGRRCSAKTDLHVDHIVPFACNGGHHSSNLQILCSAHNLRKAEKDFGEAFIQRKVVKARGERARREPRPDEVRQRP